MQTTRTRVWSILLAFIMLLTMMPITVLATDTTAESGPVDDPTSTVSGPTGIDEKVTTLNSGNYILNGDVTLTDGALTVSSGATVTLDLNGNTLTNKDGEHTIVVQSGGSLTINGTGTVDNVSHRRAAIHNAEGGTVILNGGNYTRSRENGSSETESGDNSFYNIRNYGNMTINAGVTVKQGGHYSSLIENGYYNVNTDRNNANNVPTLVINGGTFIGGINTIKNDDCGVLTIWDGSFTNVQQAAIQNHNVATIHGGTFQINDSGTNNELTFGVDNCGCVAGTDLGTLTIDGGTFSGADYGVYEHSTQGPKVTVSNGSFSGTIAAVCKTSNSNSDLSITGGTFSSDVSDYVADDYECAEPTTVGGMYTVKPLDNKLVVSGEVSGSGDSVSVSGTLSGDFSAGGTIEDKTDSSIAGDNDEESVTSEVSVNLTTNRNTTSTTLTVTNSAATSLGAATSLTVQTDVGDVKLDSAALDTIAGAVENGTDDVVISVTSSNNGYEGGTGVEAAYTVEVTSGSENLLPVGGNNGTITITVPRPNETDTLYVWYVAENSGTKMFVNQVAVFTPGTGNISFEVSHLSEYALLSVAPTSNTAVAMIGNTPYETLADAIDEAKEDDIIELQQPVALTDKITINVPNVTLDGNGQTLSVAETSNITNSTDGGLIDVTANSVVIQDLTIDAGDTIKYGVQFYNMTSGKLDGVTINGGRYSAVNVNASEVTMQDSTLNPGTGSYATIDYSIGSADGLNTIPAIHLNNVSSSSAIKVWADNATVGRVQTLMTGTPNAEDATEEIRSNITTENNVAITVSIEVEKDTSEDETVPSTKPSTGSSGTTRYNITIEDMENGDVTSSHSRASRGTTVTLTINPDDGYELDELIVTDVNGDEIDLTRKSSAKYTFEMPRSRVTIEATFVEEEVVSTLPFDDVDVDDWFYDAVEYAYENDLMNGVSSDEFDPNGTLTRGMMVTVLYRLEGEPESRADLPFEDVEPGTWYTEAVRWAVDEGIVLGTSDTTYEPDAMITREQLATMLYRYAAYKDYDTTQGGMAIREFEDYEDISDWALEGLDWAVNAELVNGVGNNTIAPLSSATRAETATLLMRFIEAFEA